MTATESSKHITDNLHHFKPSVRRINGLEIYFRSKHSVVVNHTGGTTVFYRDVKSGSYTRYWRLFTERLRRNNSLKDIYSVFAIANKYPEIDSISRYQRIRVPPDTPQRQTIFIEQRNKQRRNHGKKAKREN